jgi:sugar phosphate isomerase/epimerase
MNRKREEVMSSISRRRFLQRGTILATASLVPSLPARTWAAHTGVPIGIQLYTVGQELQKDVSGTLKQIRDIGYTEVETAGFAGLTAKQFRAELDKAGLNCHSAHLQWNSPDLSPVFADAQALGVHFVVSSGLFAPGESAQPTVDAYKKMAAHINDIARRAQQAGLQYAYHNHNFEFKDLGDGKIGYDVLLAETEPSLVDFELDCGWMVAAGYSPVQYFRKYPQRYKMLHIKDFVRGREPSTSLAQGLRPQGTELGRGYIDYRPILKAAARTAVKYYYVEQEPPFPDMPALQAAKVDYDYLHHLQESR